MQTIRRLDFYLTYGLALANHSCVNTGMILFAETQQASAIPKIFLASLTRIFGVGFMRDESHFCDAAFVSNETGPPALHTNFLHFTHIINSILWLSLP